MISVVIPAYNEEKGIVLLLTSLVHQKTVKKFEVIVVDNGSTDHTSEVVRQFGTSLRLSIITEQKKGRGAARARGFSEAHGDVIVSTDADTIVPDTWIESLTGELTTHKCVAVTGPCLLSDGPQPSRMVIDMLHPAAMTLYRILFGHYWLSGFNFAIYKRAYEQSGGFDPTLNALEDIDLAFRVRNVGTIHFAPRIKVMTSGRRFRSGLISAIASYIKPFMLYLFSGQKKVQMSDVR